MSALKTVSGGTQKYIQVTESGAGMGYMQVYSHRCNAQTEEGGTTLAGRELLRLHRGGDIWIIS